MPPELTSEAWTQIRYDYEHTGRPIEDICAAHGISSGTLRDRTRRWGWARRRPPIPRQGPPPAPRIEATGGFTALTPTPTLPLSGGGRREAAMPPASVWQDAEPALITATPQVEMAAPCAAVAPPVATGDDASAPAASDDAAIVPRLQGAVARVLPAIEATLARLAAGPMLPREMEQTARALGSLTRTLRELNGLLSQRQAAAANRPRDVAALRASLARKVEALIAEQQDQEAADGGEWQVDGEAEAFVASRTGEAGGGGEADGT